MFTPGGNTQPSTIFIKDKCKKSPYVGYVAKKFHKLCPIQFQSYYKICECWRLYWTKGLSCAASVFSARAEKIRMNTPSNTHIYQHIYFLPLLIFIK